MRAFVNAILILSGLALALSFAGSIHGVGDSVAVFRPVLVVVAGVFSLLSVALKPWRLGLFGLCLSLFAAWTLLPPPPVSWVPSNARVYQVYQKNLLFRLPDTTPVAEDILASGADIVLLQELHARNRPILDALRTAYPHQSFCPFAAVGGIAVLSRWPALQETCGEGSGLAVMQAETPDGPLWVVSLHLHWPFPYGQPEQVAYLLPMLEMLEGPVLVGGDFNMVPWSHAVDAIGEATGAQVSGYAGGTFTPSYHSGEENLVAWMPRLPIDHVLVPASGATISVERRPRFGSDHHGVLAAFVMKMN